MTVRAKFRCASVETYAQTSGHRNYRFSAMYDPEVPEDQRYAKYTPTGSLTITVDNPAVNFEPGKDYYLDFTPVDAGGDS
jgi:hypothetical protein